MAVWIFLLGSLDILVYFLQKIKTSLIVSISTVSPFLNDAYIAKRWPDNIAFLGGKVLIPNFCPLFDFFIHKIFLYVFRSLFHWRYIVEWIKFFWIFDIGSDFRITIDDVRFPWLSRASLYIDRRWISFPPHFNWLMPIKLLWRWVMAMDDDCGLEWIWRLKMNVRVNLLLVCIGMRKRAVSPFLWSLVLAVLKFRYMWGILLGCDHGRYSVSCPHQSLILLNVFQRRQV